MLLFSISMNAAIVWGIITILIGVYCYKQIQFKKYGTAVLLGLLCIFTFSVAKSCATLDNDISNSSELTPESNSSSSNDNSSLNNIGKKIIRDVYESNENGLKTYLKFESSEGCDGMCGSLTLSNNATVCKYIYTYNITKNTIKADFYNSDCGESSNNKIFTYNEVSNTISCDINGQDFIFKSIY